MLQSFGILVTLKVYMYNIVLVIVWCMQQSYQTLDDRVLVPDELVQELVDLRFSYAIFLRKYQKELQNSFEARETFVETLPTLITGKELPSDHSFQSYFKMLIDEEVSLFNITYLDKFCKIFPADIR